MNIENLVYNCSGNDYYIIFYHEGYKKTCLYGGRHGNYIGEIVDDKIYDSKTGDYLGEILDERLIIDNSKIGVDKIKGNFMFKGFGRMGYACAPRKKSLEVPKGYSDFKVGL